MSNQNSIRRMITMNEWHRTIYMYIMSGDFMELYGFIHIHICNAINNNNNNNSKNYHNGTTVHNGMTWVVVR